MPKTILQLVNGILSLVGEQPLTSTSGTVGTLVKDAVNTALSTIVQETRANIFETIVQINATNEDYLVPAVTLDSNIVQVFSVHIRGSSGLTTGDNLYRLEYYALDELYNKPGFSIEGSNVYISPLISRPITLRIQALKIPTLPTSDATDTGLPDAVLSCLSHMSAAIVALSYLDDANQAAVHENLGQRLLDKLKSQYGRTRAKVYNFNNIRKLQFTPATMANVIYAPIDSPAFIGTPTAPSPPPTDDSTKLATTAWVKGILLNRPLVVANSSGSQVVPFNTFTAVQFANESIDTNGRFDTTTGVFTLGANAEAGFYVVQASVFLVTPANFIQLQLLKNGSFFAELAVSGDAADNVYQARGQAILSMVNGDSVSIRLLQGNTGSASRTIANTSALNLFRLYA